MILFYLLPYIALLLLTVFLPKLFNRRVYMYLLFLIFFVFCGFRYGVGWDYFNYLPTLVSARSIGNTEFVVRQIEWICYDYGFTQFFFVATSFFTILFFFLMISKESVNPGVSVFVYLTMAIFFFHSMTTIRFTMAVAIGFFACYFGYKKKYIPYFAFLFLSILTHKAALFGVLTIPFVLKKIKFGISTNMVIFVTCFVLGMVFSSLSIISSVFNALMDNSFLADYISDAESYLSEKGSGFSRTPFIYAAISLINLFSMENIEKYDEDNIFGHYATMFNMGCSFVFLFSFNPTFASRIGDFFLVTILLIVPYYNHRTPVQKFLLYSLLLFGFFYQLTISTNHPDFIGRPNCWLPYRMNFTFY